MSSSNEEKIVNKEFVNTSFIGPQIELSKLQQMEMRLVNFINDRDEYYNNIDLLTFSNDFLPLPQNT